MKLRVYNRTRGVLIADAAEIADTSETRRRGLLGRTSMRPGEGLWIVPCEAVHCFWMKMTIDVLFLSKARREGGGDGPATATILKSRPGLKPWRMAACLRAHSVLELPEGQLAATGAEAGDVLELMRVPS
jgi:hypothetical protein